MFYRTENTVVNELAIRYFSRDLYIQARYWVNELLPLNDFLIYSLPEGLWVFSITLTSKAFYLKLGRIHINGIWAPLLISGGLELLQWANVANGYFDFMDLLASLIGWVVAMYLIPVEKDQRNLISPLTSGSITCLSSYAVVYLSHVNL